MLSAREWNVFQHASEFPPKSIKLTLQPTPALGELEGGQAFLSCGFPHVQNTLQGGLDSPISLRFSCATGPPMPSCRSWAFAENGMTDSKFSLGNPRFFICKTVLC